jgi:hypothetical protein
MPLERSERRKAVTFADFLGAHAAAQRRVPLDEIEDLGEAADCPPRRGS